MGFCIFLITEDLSFRLFGLKLSTRSQTSGGSRAGARGTRPLPPSNFRPKERKTGEESESNLLHENVLTALHWF